MRGNKLKHLRLKGRQWQFFKRLPKDIAEHTGKSFHVSNLGTADVIQAMKLRDRKLIELDDMCERSRQGVSDDDIALANEFREAASGHDKDTLALHLSDQAESRPNGAQWFQKVTGQAVTISFNVDRFLRECPAAATTLAARKSTIRRFELWLSSKKHRPFLDGVSKVVAGDFASHLSNQGLTQNSVNSHLSYLSSYWKWLVKRGLVDDNPFAGQQLSIKGTTQPRLAWELTEVTHLLSNAPSRFLLHAVAIAALSGLRAGEVAALRVDDCKDDVFNIRKGKTPASKRKVPIHAQLTAIIASRTEGRSGDEFLLAELKGKAKEFVKRFGNYRATLYGKSADLGQKQSEKTLHSLRHAFVTQRLQAGCEFYLVESLVGHAPQGVTLGNYHHGSTLEQLRKVVEAVSLPTDTASLFTSEEAHSEELVE